MRMKFTRTAACLAALGLAVCTAVDARPPDLPPGGPGIRTRARFPGTRLGRTAPPPRHHHNRWHDFGRDVLGGTLVLGLGLGLANAITNATTPTYTAPTYVAPSYVAPTYAAPNLYASDLYRACRDSSRGFSSGCYRPCGDGAGCHRACSRSPGCDGSCRHRSNDSG